MSDRDDEGHGRFVPHPSDEEFHTYDATDEEEERGRGPLLLAGIILLLAAFGGVLFFAYQQGVKEGMRSAPPLIRAEQGPAKVTPQDPGGMEIPHQDKRIYDRIAGAESEEEGVERLLPRAEEPMKKSPPLKRKRLPNRPAPRKPLFRAPHLVRRRPSLRRAPASPHLRLLPPALQANMWSRSPRFAARRTPNPASPACRSSTAIF
jgi:hypothetical protein